MNRPKTKVLFVGSFRRSTTKGFFGGMMYASTSLVEAEGGTAIDWIKLDTTARSNKGRWKIEILFQASLRMLRFLFLVIFKRPDTVLLFCSHSASFVEKGTMAIIAKWLGKKTVLAPRSGLIKNNIERSPRFVAYLKAVFRRVDVLICQSESWRIFYQNYASVTGPKLVVQPNWIDLKAYSPVLSDYPSNRPLRVLFLGWITANKGVYDILAAARQLQGETIEFLLGGDGDASKDLSDQIEKERLTKEVKLLGWVHGEQKMELLRTADVFILPSYREGYPNALLEAMAMAKAVISTRVGAIPDLINDRENGLLIAPGTPEQLADGIKWLMTNPEQLKQLGEAARHTLVTNNSLSEAVVRMREILVKD